MPSPWLRLSLRSRVHELLCLETYGSKLDTSVIYLDIQRVHVELGPIEGELGRAKGSNRMEIREWCLDVPQIALVPKDAPPAAIDP
jgi:hypothetical protein